MGSARTLQKGKFQGMVNPGVIGAAASTTSGAGSLIVPQLEVGARYGITDHFELGAKAWIVGFMVDGKIGIIRPDDPDWGLNLSIAPGVGYLGVGAGSTGGSGSINQLNFYVPVLVGLRFGGHELVLAPKVIDTLTFGGGAAANVVSVGGSVGFAIKIGESFKLMPEFSIIAPVLVSGGGSTAGIGSAVMFQGGLGFLFGGAEERRTEAPPLQDTVNPEGAPPAGTTGDGV